MSKVTVNFVAFDEERDACLMVLVEGPWDREVDSHLRDLQDRLFGCLEAALDGQLAEQFPDAQGKTVIVRVDCYGVPQDEVRAFIDRFAEGIASLSDYSTAASLYVSGFLFEANFGVMPDDKPMSVIAG